MNADCITISALVSGSLASPLQQRGKSGLTHVDMERNLARLEPLNLLKLVHPQRSGTKSHGNKKPTGPPFAPKKPAVKKSQLVP